MSIFADLTPSTGVERRVDLGDDKTLLFMDDGRVLFRHRCLTGRSATPGTKGAVSPMAAPLTPRQPGSEPHTTSCQVGLTG